MVAVITEILTGTVTAGPVMSRPSNGKLLHITMFPRPLPYPRARRPVRRDEGDEPCPRFGSDRSIVLFFTVPGVVRALGHVPVFAPCDPGTFAIDPARLESVITDRTSAVIVIHPSASRRQSIKRPDLPSPRNSPYRGRIPVDRRDSAPKTSVHSAMRPA